MKDEKIQKENKEKEKKLIVNKSNKNKKYQ